MELRCPGPVPNGLEAFPSSYKMGTESLSGWIKGKIGALANQALLAQRLRKSRAMPLLPFLTFMASSRMDFTSFLTF